MDITKAMYLAHDMINRAKAGDGVVNIVASLDAFSGFGSHLKKVEDSTNRIKRHIPNEAKYDEVIETLKEHKEYPGVEPMLREVLETYPHLKEKTDQEEGSLDFPEGSGT